MIGFLSAEIKITAADISTLNSLLDGRQESEELDNLLAHMRPGATVVDIGSWSVFGSQADGPVLAFEPLPANATFLRTALDRNRATMQRSSGTPSVGRQRPVSSTQPAGSHARGVDRPDRGTHGCCDRGPERMPDRFRSRRNRSHLVRCLCSTRFGTRAGSQGRL